MTLGQVHMIALIVVFSHILMFKSIKHVFLVFSVRLTALDILFRSFPKIRLMNVDYMLSF